MTRVIRNDPSKALRYGQPVLPSHILETFADWKLYGHIVSAFLTMYVSITSPRVHLFLYLYPQPVANISNYRVMIQPVNTYAPSMIKSLGFSGLQANGMNSVGSVGSLILSISLAYSSDRFRERGLHIALGFLWGAAGLLWLALAHDGVSKWVLYGKLLSP